MGLVREVVQESIGHPGANILGHPGAGHRLRSAKNVSIYLLVKHERGYVQTSVKCAKSFVFSNRWTLERFIKPHAALKRESEVQIIQFG